MFFRRLKAIVLVCMPAVLLTACVAAVTGDTVPMTNEGVPPDADPYTLVPDPGPCEAAIPHYYYDPATRMCKEFLWGGCGGVVPFETMEECTAGAPAADGDAQAAVSGDAVPEADDPGASEGPAVEGAADGSGNPAARTAASAADAPAATANDTAMMDDTQILIGCNAAADEVEVYNMSEVALDLGGYRLFNDDRSRVFTFPEGFTLAVQASAYVVSGPDAEPDPAQQRLLFTTDDVWTGNFAAAHLENGDGVLVSQALCFED